MNREDPFGKDYFDGGEDRRGPYKEYTLSSMYSRSEALASRLCGMLRPRQVLDVGCAKGFLVLAFRRLDVESYGVDISAYALEQAPAEVRCYLSKVDLNKGTLPYDAGIFDLVTASFVLDYVRDLDHALTEIRRVMASDGTLFVRCLYPKSGVGFATFGQRRIEEKAWIGELGRRQFEFMAEITNDNYAMLIREWLQRDLANGRGYKYQIGRQIFRVPRLGELVLTKHARSRIGLLFFRARG